MDPLGHWMRSRSFSETRKVGSKFDNYSKAIGSVPALVLWKDPAIDTSEWEVLDLSEGSDWYQTQVFSLHQAIRKLPSQVQHLEDGIQALAHHWINYTSKGPEQLQLLWWEFPNEHWGPLCEGCSMNFLISPEGKLQMNSKMDEAGKKLPQPENMLTNL